MDSLSREREQEKYCINYTYTYRHAAHIYILSALGFDIGEALCLNLATSYNSIPIEATIFSAEKGKGNSLWSFCTTPSLPGHTTRFRS